MGYFRSTSSTTPSPVARADERSGPLCASHCLGLYISNVAATLQLAYASDSPAPVCLPFSPTIADPLCDAIINAADYHDRHDKPLRCRYDALSVVTHDKVILGDKKESRERYAQWNATHVPDIIHVRLATDELLEVKVVSPLTKHNPKERRLSAKNGGNPCTPRPSVTSMPWATRSRNSP